MSAINTLREKTMTNPYSTLAGFIYNHRKEDKKKLLESALPTHPQYKDLNKEIWSFLRVMSWEDLGLTNNVPEVIPFVFFRAKWNSKGIKIRTDKQAGRVMRMSEFQYGSLKRQTRLGFRLQLDRDYLIEKYDKRRVPKVR